LKVSCGRVEVDYYDEHFPPPQQGPVIGRKPFRFAYQRELRFFLLPEGRSRPAFGQHVCFSAEKMNDIAGVYNSIGEKEAGYGPIRNSPKHKISNHRPRNARHWCAAKLFAH
jgi:hypothetical protein